MKKTESFNTPGWIRDAEIAFRAILVKSQNAQSLGTDLTKLRPKSLRSSGLKGASAEGTSGTLLALLARLAGTPALLAFV